MVSPRRQDSHSTLLQLLSLLSSLDLSSIGNLPLFYYLQSLPLLWQWEVDQHSSSITLHVHNKNMLKVVLLQKKFSAQFEMQLPSTHKRNSLDNMTHILLKQKNGDVNFKWL